MSCVMLDQTTLETRIGQIFAKEMHASVPSVDTDLIDEGILDSLAFVDLIFRLEKEFGIKIAVDALEIDEVRTVRKIAAFVRSKTAAAP